MVEWTEESTTIPYLTPVSKLVNLSCLVFSQPKKKKTRKNRKKKDPNAETSGTGFQILGEQIDKNRNKVARVLPSWLAKPDFVSVDLSDQQMPVDEMRGKIF